MYFVCVHMYVEGHAWHSRSALVVCWTVSVSYCRSLFEKTVLVIFHRQFILLCFCSLISVCLRTAVIGAVNQSVQSLVVKKWKWVIISSPRSAQPCYIWHSVFIGVRPLSAHSFTPSSLLPFPFPPPPTSLLHFLPPLPSHSFLPLFAFAPLIHFQCQLLPFLCQMTLPHSLYCVCLTTKERLGRGKQAREGKSPSCWLATKWQISFSLTAGLWAFLQLNTVVKLWLNIRSTCW